MTDGEQDVSREASSREPSGEAEPEEAETRRRKAVVLFVVVFLLAATGAYAAASRPTEPVPTDLYEATGDLTVTVESQTDATVTGKEVSLVNPDSGEVIATGTTDGEGAVTFRNIEQATYRVRVDRKTHKVRLSSEESITVGVTVTPPKSSMSASLPFRLPTGPTCSRWCPRAAHPAG